MRLACSLFLLLLFSGLPAQARVFSYETSWVAGYIRGTVGFTQLGADAFANGAGGKTIFPDSADSDYQFSGELGFLFSAGPVNFRLGIEALRPKEVEADGTNSATGAKLMRVTSEVFVFSPMITAEYIYATAGDWRFFTYLGVGYATVTVDNTVDLTTAGTTLYSPIVDHTEKSSATTYTTMLGFGFETIFVDSVSFTMDLGYRHLPVKELKYNGTTSTLAEAAPEDGGPVLNMDGNSRSIDLSGFYIGGSFRFFLNFGK